VTLEQSADPPATAKHKRAGNDETERHFMEQEQIYADG